MKKYYVILLVSVLSISVQAQKKTLLRLKPEVGGAVKSKIEMTMIMNMDMGERKMETTMNMGFGLTYKTISRDSDVNTMQISYDNMTMNMTNPMMSGAYDSDNYDEADPFSKQIASSLEGVFGNPFPVKVDVRGKLTEQIDLTSVFKNTPLAKKKELQEQINNQFIVFPEEKVGVGSKWSHSVNVSSIGKMKYTYTVLEISKGEVLASLTGELENTPNPSIKVTSSDINGKVTFNKKTGMTNTMDINMDFVMDVNQEGKLMTMDVASKVHVVNL